MEKIDNIKNLYSQIEKKKRKDFIEKVAKEFNISLSSARSNWFSRFDIKDAFGILHDRLIKFMQNFIKQQNLTKKHD